jgi:vacuolar-type H+-ATPase subunit H
LFLRWNSCEKVRREEGVDLSSPAIMNKIVEAEKESRQMLDQANKEISELKRDVSNKTASMREHILQEATKRRENELAQAEKTGVEEAKRIALESKKQLESISQIPSTQRRQAVDRAVDLVLS